MLTKIVQNGLLVLNLEESVAVYRRLFDLRFTDGRVWKEYGLRNAVMKVGEGTFLELMEPFNKDLPAWRHLAQRGPHGWQFYCEGVSVEEDMQRIQSEGARMATPGIHPSSTPGFFLSISPKQTDDNPWPAAGNNWWELPDSTIVSRMRQIVGLVTNLEVMAERYQAWFGLKLAGEESGQGIKAVRLATADSQCLVLVQPVDDSSQMAGDLAEWSRIDRWGPWQYATCLETRDLAKAEQHLRQLGVKVEESSVPFSPGLVVSPDDACGTRVILLDPR